MSHAPVPPRAKMVTMVAIWPCGEIPLDKNFYRIGMEDHCIDEYDRNQHIVHQHGDAALQHRAFLACDIDFLV